MNPNVTIIAVSAKTGAGLSAWFDWVQKIANIHQSDRPSTLTN